jgi:hypothetical protein
MVLASTTARSGAVPATGSPAVSVAALARDLGLYGFVQVGILQHQERRLTAQFQQHRLQMLGCSLGDNLAHGSRAGEIDALHGRVVDECSHHLSRIFRRIG